MATSNFFLHNVTFLNETRYSIRNKNLFYLYRDMSKEKVVLVTEVL